jgi:ribosomal protein L2
VPLKLFKPTSPGRRGASGPSFEEVTKKKPERSLALSRYGTEAAERNGFTASSISSETRTACPAKWRPSSTTPTVRHV